MKIRRFIIVFLFCLFIFVYATNIMGLLNNEYNISYQGFAVDNKGNIYVGFYSGQIKKFNGGKLLGVISAQTSRGYDFTITENDTLYITCGDRAYFTDLDGNVLETITDNIQPFYKYRYNKSIFLSKDGTKYEKKFNFGKTKFVKCQEQQEITIYEMPLKDYISKVVLIVGSVVIYGAVIVLIIKVRQSEDGDQSGGSSVIEP